MNPLFSPIKLKGLTLPNRIVVPPMDQYSADEGRPVHWHAMHYGTLAVSGAGLLIVEATAVEAPGRISPQDLGLWNEEQEVAHKAMLDSIRAYSSTPIGIPGARVLRAYPGKAASRSCPKTAGGKYARLPPCPMRRAIKHQQNSRRQTLPALQNLL